MRLSSKAMRARREDAGFSLAELLVVVAIIGLFCLVAIPSVGNYIRAGKVRAGNDMLMGDLRAVRYIAITNHAAGSLTISLNTTTGIWSWTYSDIHGNSVNRTLEKNVRFTTPSTGSTTVTFASDGTVSTGATTLVIRGNVLTNVDHQYTISVTTIGRLSSAFAKV